MKSSEIFSSLILIVIFNIYDANGDVQGLMDVWREVNEEYTNDIIQSTQAYKKIKAEQQAMADLEIIVKRHLITKNSEQLTNAINTYEISKSNDKLYNLSVYIMENYDDELIEDILYEVIQQKFKSKPTPQLVDLFHNIYKAEDPKSFEFMVHAQLKLIYFYTEKYQYNDTEFLQKFAFNLNKIKQNKLYTQVKLTLKSSVDAVIARLPNNLQFLFFYPYFCLMNAKYSEYIYTTAAFKIDQNSYYIWLWNTKFTIDDMGPIKAQVFETQIGNTTNFKFTLEGVRYQLYYYMMPSNNKIAGWGLKTEPFNYIWDLEFLDNDRVLISQNKYYMCSTDDMYDEARRNVAGYKDEEFWNGNEGCQWYLGKCDRRQ